MNYDATIFCEIIESIHDIEFIRQEEIDGFFIRVYQSSSGTVRIDFDDDNFTNSIAKGYLIQLGRADLIISMFPNDTGKPEISIPFIPDKQIATDCDTCKGIGQMQLENGSPIKCLRCNGSGTITKVVNTVTEESSKN